ncbi:RNA polymerase sigma factor [Thalassotalea mangrovi]|uniref:RNA polymerase sigma factor n=1 Tax=Thalassotalea mangrovi TaxID=2572245 RepID=UPI00145F4EB3|nr:RNA polymerase sigma factor [Thalassotalea mangrovi]
MSILKDWLNRFQQQRDSQSFAQVVAQCQTPLQGYCRRLTAGDMAMADDIAQETLISVYQQVGQLQNLDAFKSWLYRIAYRHFLHIQAKQNRWKSMTEQELEFALQQETGCGSEQQACEDERLVLQYMALLTHEERAVITLNHTLEYSHQQIASLLDMPLGTVKSHAKRGKDKLIAFSHRQQRGAA